MNKKYILTACLFWVCSLASAQITLPAFQGAFGKRVVTGTVPSAPRSPVATSGYEEAIVSLLLQPPLEEMLLLAIPSLPRLEDLPLPAQLLH